MVDEHAPNRLGGKGEEVCPPAPLDLSLVHHAKIRFVNEGRRLKGVIGPLVPEVTLSQSAQLIVHQRKESIRGRSIPLAGILEHSREFSLTMHG